MNLVRDCIINMKHSFYLEFQIKLFSEMAE